MDSPRCAYSPCYNHQKVATDGFLRTMRILLLGDDGRAHTLTWKLFNSPLVSELIAAPGNGGTGALVPSAELDLSEAAAIARWSFDESIDIVVPADSRP